MLTEEIKWNHKKCSKPEEAVQEINKIDKPLVFSMSGGKVINAFFLKLT